MEATPPTRLLLSALPPSLTLPLLRAHISLCPPQPPQLTDLKILLKPDGTSRRIAFVGFKEHTEGARLLAWIEGSWIAGVRGGARISAAWAKEAKDAPPPRKRSRPTPTANLEDSLSTSAVPPATNNDEADRLAEFMAVMAPKKKRTLASITSAETASVPNQPPPRIPLSVATDEDQVIGDAVAPNTLGEDDVSDNEYMARRMKRRLGEDDEISDAGDRVDVFLGASSNAKPWAPDELDVGELAARPGASDADAIHAHTSDQQALAIIRESSRLFVRNLGFAISELDLRGLFSPFGEISTVHIPFDEATRSAKGIAYITFSLPTSAISAFSTLDRTTFQGRLLHILPAIVRNPKPEDSFGDGTLKDARQDARKKVSSTSGLSWGTLFMNSDAVVSSVADRLGITKATILDPSADNAAVRVALAETHVIAETKQYFESEGVDLGALAAGGPRSPTTILIKNIPYGTSASTLVALFSPYGGISRLLLPPAGTIAIIEMDDEPAAKEAWRGCAYKKLGGSVLYLEKAPRGVFNGEPAASRSPDTPATPSLVAADPTAGSGPMEAGSTLFIKNLSFASTTASLTAAFSHLPAFVFARVQTKTDPKRPGQTLSMGFGFAGFRTVGAAQNAMRSRQGFALEGHQLEIKFAQRGKDDRGSEGSAGQLKGAQVNTSTKLLVKNVPFEVTRKEIRELFGAYGQLKSVRLPRKLDQKTRGFAFLEFVSHREALAAFTALEHTHLLGRHLVLQWAKEGDETVQDLRDKIGSFSNRAIGARKDKFVMDGTGSGALEGGGEDGTEG